MEGFFRKYLRVYRPLITKLNDLLSVYELSYSLWEVIFYVKNFGPSTLVDISTYYQIEKPSITRRVHRLEELQMLQQIPGTDKREKIIQLTDIGEEIYLACRKKITELEYRVMEGTSKEEQSAVFQILPKIQNHLINKEGNKHG